MFRQEDVAVDDLPHLRSQDIDRLLPKAGPRARLTRWMSGHMGGLPVSEGAGSAQAAMPLSSARRVELKDMKLEEPPLGIGRCAKVYASVYHGTPVAVKVLHEVLGAPAGDQAAQRDFEREVQLMCSLVHPNLVSAMAFSLTDRAIVMHR